MPWGHSLTLPSRVLGESPPSPPRVFFGRDGLIEEIVGLAENLNPVALIGAGGIGKTSIALTVLHHDRIEQLCCGRSITRPLPRRSNSRSPLQCSKNLGLTPEDFSGSSPSSLKVSTRTTLTGCFPPSQTEQTSSTSSVLFPWRIETTNSSRCLHRSGTISVPKIPSCLHSSVWPRNVISTDCRSRLIPTDPGSRRHNGLYQRM